MAEDFDEIPTTQDVLRARGRPRASSYVHVDTAQGVARITLNRPPANVLSVDMMQELAPAPSSPSSTRGT